MKIATESELVEQLMVGLKKTFNTDIAVKEMSAGYGIADLVFAKNFLTKNNNLNRTPLNNYLAVKLILNISNNECIKIEDVMHITSTSISTSRKIINQLIKDNYIKKINKNQFVKNIEYHNPIKNIVAIEAKLRDWKSGAMQARRYKSFTDECYLAILEDYNCNIDYNYLKKFGIGLILYNQYSGNISIKIKPKKNVLSALYDYSFSQYAKELLLSNTLSKLS